MRRTDTTAGEFADFEPCSDKAAPRLGFAAVSADTAVGKLSADHSFAHSLAVQKLTARDSAEMQKLRVKLFHSVYFRAKSARSPFRAKRLRLRYFPAKAVYFPYSECFRQNYPQYTSFIKEAAQLQAMRMSVTVRQNLKRYFKFNKAVGFAADENFSVVELYYRADNGESQTNARFVDTS